MKIKTKSDSFEQINRRESDSIVLGSIRDILEQDQFNLFKLKSKVDLSTRIEVSDKEIDKLLQLKTSLQKKTQDLEPKVAKISQLNQEMIAEIGYRLNEG